MTKAHHLAAAALAALAGCTPLGPDPVIQDGVDLGPIQSFEVERIPWKDRIGTINDSQASDNHALEFYATVEASLDLEVLTDVSGLVIHARAEECQGWPELEVHVDDHLVLRQAVEGRSYHDLLAPVDLSPGMHHFSFAFTNDKFEPPCDRNLILDKVTLINRASVQHGVLPVASLVLPSGVNAQSDAQSRAKSAGRYAAFMSSGSAVGLWELDSPAGGLVIRARGDPCEGPPLLQLDVDGKRLAEIPVAARQFTDYPVNTAVAAGVHLVSVTFPNDRYDGLGCDRNLYVDDLRPVGAAASEAK